MTKTIWEYSVEAGTVSMPRGAKVLSVHEQAGYTYLWAEVQPNQPKVYRKFVMVPTGTPVPSEGTFIGAIFPDDAEFVFHIYEVPAAEIGKQSARASSSKASKEFREGA